MMMNAPRWIHWLRVLLVWGVALGMAAALAWLMVFFGAIDTDHPDPSWQYDLTFGIVFGAATQSGLLLSLWAERRGTAARGVAAVLMLPATVSLPSSVAAQAYHAEGPGAALLLVALAVYLVQLWRLTRLPFPRMRRPARPAGTPVHEG
jgi:predicted permease